MERRTFLKLTAGGLLVGAFSGFLVLNRDTKKAAINLIYKDLYYLNLDKKGVEDFVEDYMKENSHNAYLNFKIKAADILNTPQDVFQFRLYLVRNYLLSSSFFQNKMDESKLVTYNGSVYNPFKTACSNPFSHFYYPNPTDLLTQQANL